MQINLSSCRISDHYFSLSLQPLSWDSLGTKNASSTQVQMTAEKMRWKSLRVYPSEIIQTSSLGKLQKKSLEHNDCLYAVSASQQRVRNPPQKTISLVRKITFEQIVEVLFQCF